jgi:hypothetical protein
MSKKYEFLTITDNTNAGDLADDFFSAALDEAQTLNNGGVTLLEGLTYKHVLPNIAIADPVKASACGFTDSDNITITEKVLTLTDLAVQEQICIKEIVPLWKGYVREASRHGLEEPSFIEYLLTQTARAVGQSIERGIWRGDAPYGVGFTDNDGGDDETGLNASQMQDFAQVDRDTDGILTVLDAMLQGAISGGIGAILDRPGAGFYLGRDDYWEYAQALSAAGSNSGQNNGEGFSNGNKQGLTFQGFPIYTCPGITPGAAVLTYPGNLFVGTSSQTDFNEIKAIDLRETTGDEYIRMVGRMQIGVQVANEGDGVVAFNLA